VKRLILCIIVLSGMAFASADPCNSDQVVKKHAFAAISTATTTSLIAVPANPAQQIFVCSANAQLFSTTTSNTLLFVTGTGAACSSPVTVSATYTNAAGASAPVSLSSSNNVLTVPAASGFCATSTVGSTPTIAVDVTYVLQ
jgi:hypothetical protein